MIVRGSIRSWTCSETVGTSKLVRSALPAQTSCGSRWGSYAYVLRPASGSVSGVTSPTGGLFARFWSLCSYCSMGFLGGFLAGFFGAGLRGMAADGRWSVRSAAASALLDKPAVAHRSTAGQASSGTPQHCWTSQQWHTAIEGLRFVDPS